MSNASANVRAYTAIVERCAVSGLLVGYVPGFASAHTQGASLDEVAANLQEVVGMLLEDGEPTLSANFVGTLRIGVE